MTTAFETAKVGDRVWSTVQGWGKIIRIDDNSSYPLVVKFDSGGFNTFTFGGYVLKSNAIRILFWGEIVIEAPVKPLPDLAVDTKVLVWSAGGKKHKRHFSHFEENGRIRAFAHGTTSFSVSKGANQWDNWELAE